MRLIAWSKLGFVLPMGSRIVPNPRCETRRPDFPSVRYSISLQIAWPGRNRETFSLRPYLCAVHVWPADQEPAAGHSLSVDCRGMTPQSKTPLAFFQLHFMESSAGRVPSQQGGGRKERKEASTHRRTSVAGCASIPAPYGLCTCTTLSSSLFLPLPSCPSLSII